MVCVCAGAYDVRDVCVRVYDELITTCDAIRLERLQNSAAKIITGTLIRTSSEKLKAELGWTSLSERRKQHKLTLYHSIINCPGIPKYIKEIKK